MSEDVTKIICADYSEELLMRLPGNRRVECDGCGQPVVISRPGLKLQAEPPADAPAVRVICFRCALRDDPDQEFQSVPGAMELAAAYGVPLSHLARHQTKTVREFIEEAERRR